MAEVGQIILWAGSLSNIPPGYLNCDGTQIAQSDYPELWKTIGTSFGGNPSPGNFYLPDLRGRFIRGVDTGAGRDPNVGSRTDMQNPSVTYSGVGSIQPDAFRMHAHIYNALGVGGEIVQDGGGFGWSELLSGPIGDSETRPINAYLHFLICCQPPSNASR